MDSEKERQTDGQVKINPSYPCHRLVSLFHRREGLIVEITIVRINESPI